MGCRIKILFYSFTYAGYTPLCFKKEIERYKIGKGIEEVGEERRKTKENKVGQHKCPHGVLVVS